MGLLKLNPCGGNPLRFCERNNEVSKAIAGLSDGSRGGASWECLIPNQFWPKNRHHDRRFLWRCCKCQQMQGNGSHAKDGMEPALTTRHGNYAKTKILTMRLSRVFDNHSRTLRMGKIGRGPISRGNQCDMERSYQWDTTRGSDYARFGRLQWPGDGGHG